MNSLSLTQGGYDILLSSHTIETVLMYLRSHHTTVKKLMIISDTTVRNIYGTEILLGLQGSGYTIAQYSLPPGEENKTIEHVLEIVDVYFAHSINRCDMIVSFGGGVVSDMVGFAASIYKRGVSYITIPTTLLAMVDASVGGKTGCDYHDMKNAIGTFYNPSCIIINPYYLGTLPMGQRLSGRFEAYKHACLSGEALYTRFIKMGSCLIKEDNNKNLHDLLYDLIAVKASVVEQDPYEKSTIRTVLNYGHTFGHALESYLKLQIPHGICIGYGMIYENILSTSQGILDHISSEKMNKTILNYIAQYGGNLYLTSNHIKYDDFIIIQSYMTKDKKNTNNNIINFSLLSRIGENKQISVQDMSLLQEVWNKRYKFCFTV